MKMKRGKGSFMWKRAFHSREKMVLPSPPARYFFSLFDVVVIKLVHVVGEPNRLLEMYTIADEWYTIFPLFISYFTSREEVHQ